jgi:ribosomal protein S18 acetylase RimI-like enzyme
MASSDPVSPTFPSPPASTLVIRDAKKEDLDALDHIENESFQGDRLSRRRLHHWLKAKNRVMLVCEWQGRVIGYGLVLLHKGTRLARLYSLAVIQAGQPKGYGRALLEALELAASERGRFFMRIEVSQHNARAIALYESLGYWCFDHYHDYYEDHSDALRMQKRIRKGPEHSPVKSTPWYQQTTEFTCGPSALMMAMGALAPETLKQPTLRELELDIWREATTIFMTSGHGGCHPVGLALAAKRRGFEASVWLSTAEPLFTEGVRSPQKKEVIALVDRQFNHQAFDANVDIHYQAPTQVLLDEALSRGDSVLILISTYRLDGRKAPHWVTVTATDPECIYVHDPDPDDLSKDPLDCQHVPIAREAFDSMSQFGRDKLRTAVVISARASLDDSQTPS